MSNKQDLYELLGIARGANDADIKKAYRRLAMKYHPDRTSGDKTSEEQFKAVTHAYEVLSDPQKRQMYDQFGHDAFERGHGSGPQGFGDIFNDIFADIFGGAAGGRRGKPRGADLRYNLELSLEEAIFGTEVTLDVPTFSQCDTCEGSGAKKGTKPVSCTACQGRGQIHIQQGFFSLKQTCPQCHGQGEVISDPCRTCRGQGRVRGEKKLQVKIPPGIDTGDRVRLASEGEAAPLGGEAGDLYVEAHLREHPIFQRDGHHLYCEMPISFVTAALGGDLEVPTLQGQVKLHVPSETQSGKIFKLSGKGVRTVRSSHLGDLLCKVIVETPVSLNARQRELLKEFEAASEGKKNTPHVNTWFNRVKDFFEGLKSNEGKKS